VVACVHAGPRPVALLSAWKPEATGGGSSDAVAALLGASIVLLTIGGRWEGRESPAQMYAVFFAAYLTTLDRAGLVPSIIVGKRFDHRVLRGPPRRPPRCPVPGLPGRRSLLAC